MFKGVTVYLSLTNPVVAFWLVVVADHGWLPATGVDINPSCSCCDTLSPWYNNNTANATISLLITLMAVLFSFGIPLST